jgi:hypothetical protein
MSDSLDLYITPRQVSQRRRHRRQVLGDRNLCSGTLAGQGIAPGAISIDSTAIFIAVADSHDEDGVVLPRVGVKMERIISDRPTDRRLSEGKKKDSVG